MISIFYPEIMLIIKMMLLLIINSIALFKPCLSDNNLSKLTVNLITDINNEFSCVNENMSFRHRFVKIDSEFNNFISYK